MGDLTKNFNRSEFACPCCGLDKISLNLVRKMQKLRNHFASTITINSGCRCEKHNFIVGGSKNSQHLIGFACDFVVEGYEAKTVQYYIDTVFLGSNGLGKYKTFTHFDVRTDKRARW